MPRQSNIGIMPVLLALAISAGVVWYYFFRKPKPLTIQALPNQILDIPVDENPIVSGNLITNTDTGPMSIKYTVPKYVWSASGEKMLYPGSESGKPWIWENAQIQGITAYIPGVPWDPVEAARIPNQLAADREKYFMPFGLGSD